MKYLNRSFTVGDHREEEKCEECKKESNVFYIIDGQQICKVCYDRLYPKL